MSWGDKLFYAGFSIVSLLAWLFIGISQSFDEFGAHNQAFLKKGPTFHIFFSNPYFSYHDEPDAELAKRRDSNLDWLPNTPELNNYLAYCRARYRIDLPDPIQARERCKTVEFGAR